MVMRKKYFRKEQLSIPSIFNLDGIDFIITSNNREYFLIDLNHTIKNFLAI